MGRLVYLKILGGIALLMVLSLGAAVLWIHNAPPSESREPASENPPQPQDDPNK
jgi:hypothetical protein